MITNAIPGTDERRPPSLSTLQAGLINNSLTVPAFNAEGKTGTNHLILTRAHPVIRERAYQLEINMLAIYGGRPYVEARLSRFPGEHKISWEGGTRKDGSMVTGRVEQAHCVPHPGRIAEKINQYVFSQMARRDTIDDDFKDNVTRDGLSLHQFMRQLNTYLTACGWAWIGVDMPTVGEGISLQAKEDKKVRPYWILYGPGEVVEWCFNEVGDLKWLLTQGSEYKNDDPNSLPELRKTRSLWEPGKKTTYWYDEKAKKVMSEVTDLSLKGSIPFILVGVPSAKPFLFDSIESINRTILDLESVSRQNYFDRCFPQMYLPASVMTAMQNLLKGYSAEEMMEMVIGLNYPILLEPGDPTPGYIMPGSGDLSAPDQKIQQLKRDMFECVGMMLRAESRAAQSAEAKSWDHLDVEQVLKDRANLLQEAEKKAVELSKAWDETFKEYDPQWPQTFNVRDFSEDMASLIQMGQVPMPTEMSKELLNKLLDLMSKIGVSEIPEKRLKELRVAIDEFVDEASTQMERIAATPEKMGEGEELIPEGDGSGKGEDDEGEPGKEAPTKPPKAPTKPDQGEEGVE
jgi:hypothetical protein